MTNQTFKKDKLTVHVLEDRLALGRHAAAMAAEKLKTLARTQDSIDIIFAAAPSQNEFLAALVSDKTIPWQKINAFHMDEYIGLPAGAPQSFAHFLRTHIFDKVPLASVHYIDGNAPDTEQLRYTRLLGTHPPDVVFMGIGENTHLAFNDPPVADFHDARLVKQVELDAVCRRQQVNDGCFARLDEVPKYAITLTIPALMMARYIYCMVPGPTKRQAITHTLNEPVSETHPSTILREHEHAHLFVDHQSYQP
ncbi:MAG TPA: 6-phosphogluconolactonase [Puia sp.]|nr:6-phosphogluconolactonase [Puia sp.]